MTDILHRTVFMAKASDGLVRFSDWARVITGLGAMYEQRQDYRHLNMAEDFAWSDPTSRIDNIEGYDPYGPAFGEGTIGGVPAPLDGV